MPIHSAVGTLIRKTSLLRTVPTACGQAADIAAHMTPPRTAIFVAVPRDHVAMLGDCASVATLRHDRFSERSYLFTMSDITPAHQASQPHGASERRSLRTSRNSAGGARRNRTDDLLLAKQALSQLSYGPRFSDPLHEEPMREAGWDRPRLAVGRLYRLKEAPLTRLV